MYYSFLYNKNKIKGKNMRSNKSNQSSGGIGFSGMLTTIFVVLKLIGVINWSWLWVLSPIWITIILVVIIILVASLKK